MKKIKKKSKIFVAMSGGVDSSVAAGLLKNQGYDVRGVFIKGWAPEGFICPWREEKKDAARVAAILDIPFTTWDFSEEYKKKVADYMIAEYQAGHTPNSDVMCNKKIKFGIFLKKALEQGADYIATGHYIKIKEKKLFQARDKNKDQSYFLWTLTQEQLKHCLFPVGDYLKPEVRKIAKKFGLPTADKKESQGVCFVGKLNFADFLRKYIPKKEGEIRDTSGRVIGKHDGVYFYTIGQRHGLAIGGKKNPLYVAKKDFKNNVLIVAEENNPLLYKKEILVSNVNWISGHPMSVSSVRRSASNMSNTKTLKCKARIRYRQPLQDCEVYAKNKKEAKVIFQKLQRAVAQGQSVVFYLPSEALLRPSEAFGEGGAQEGKGQEMLGGGVIF